MEYRQQPGDALQAIVRVEDRDAAQQAEVECEWERKRDPQASHLVVSSYAPVYGTLTEDGRKLYVADGVNYREYLFDLQGAKPRSLPVNESIKSRHEVSIREWVGRINRLYGLTGGGSR